jgi:hypothetical protein
MKKTLLSLLVMSFVLVVSASAQVLVGWGDSPTNGASLLESFDCLTSTGTSTLVVSLAMPIDVPGVTGFSVDFRFYTSDGGECYPGPCGYGPLPAYWDLRPTGCRAGAISCSADFSAAPWVSSTQVADPWQAGALVLGGPWTLQPAYPGAPPESSLVGHYVVEGALPEGASVNLARGQEYFVARVTIRHTKSSAPGGCAGCCVPVVFVPTVQFIQGAQGPGTPFGVTSLPAAWQGSSGAACNLVPTRASASTWGALKSTYR